MAFLIAWVMLGCGESVTFEEPPEAEVPVEVDEAPLEADGYDPVNVPEDGREEIEARPDAKAQGAKKQPWPPVVIPQDAREREWKWEFDNQGSTKKFENRREPTREEMGAMEEASMPEGWRPGDEDD